MNLCSIDKNNEEIVLADEILREMHRRVVKSFLDIIILEKLNDEIAPVGAYDVINFIHRELGVAYGPDLICALLYSCEKDGLIKSGYNGETKVYSLTDEGKDKIKIIMQEKPRILNLIFEFLLIELPSF